MNYPKTFQHILTELASQMVRLSDSDFEKINDGVCEISIKVTEKKRTKNKKCAAFGKQSYDVMQKEVVEKLYACKTREDGFRILEDYFKSAEETKKFAKSLDVMVIKKDKVAQIRNKIVEATIGSVLRSNAIRGKTMQH